MVLVSRTVLSPVQIVDSAHTDCYAKSAMGNTERERLFAVLEELGWTIAGTNKKGYVKALCGCGKHKMWVHKTPSNPYYYDQQMKWVKRQGCQ